ncbi:MAG: O-antigen ligase family protein [Acidobacteriota bacterium]
MSGDQERSLKKNNREKENAIVNQVEQPAHVPPIARFLERVIYFSLLTTIVLTAIPYGTVQPWWISIFECLVFGIAILSVIEVIISKRWSMNLLMVAPLLALILFAAIQSLPMFAGPGPMNPRTALSADPYSTLLFAIQLTALTLVFLLLRRYTSSKARLRGLIYVIIGVGLASALFGIVRQSLQHTPGFFLPALPVGGRGFGQFINRNHFALLLEMSLGLTLGLIVGEVGRHRRILILLPIAVLLWVALIYSNSRGGILASLCQLLFLGVLLDPVRHLTDHRGEVETSWKRFRNLAGGLAVRIFLMGCLIGLVAYGVGWVGGEPVVSNFQNAASDFSQQEMENNTNSSRKEIWSATWQMIKANPLAGLGFGGYWVGITRYHHASGEITPQQAHNDYLELIASGGLIACLLGIWFGASIVKKARERLRSPDPYYRAACLGALAGMFGVAVHSFVDFGLHITINALLLFGLFVIAVQNDQLAYDRAGGGRGMTAASPDE